MTSEKLDTTYTYLASPYSHATARVREIRYAEAKAATAWLLKKRIWVYSPIVHSHPLAILHTIPTDFDYWQEYDRAMIRGATDLMVLTIEGWEKSVGVAGEMKYAKELGKLISTVCPDPYQDGEYIRKPYT